MIRNINKVLVLAVTSILMFIASPSLTQAARKGYSIETGNTEVFSDTNLSYHYGWIYDSDEVIFQEIYNNYCKVTYPVSRGTKTGYVHTDAFFTAIEGKGCVASARITSYRRPGGKVYGYVDKGDQVVVLKTLGMYTQVYYPVTGGYKAGFVKKTDCENYLLKERHNEDYEGGIPVKGYNGSKQFFVFLQNDKAWGKQSYKRGCFNGVWRDATIGSSGCHLLALVNATHYLSGKFISPKQLATYAIDKGYRKNGSIDMEGLYKSYLNSYGKQYGIKYGGCVGANYQSLRNHLSKGEVVAAGVEGHVVAIVYYRNRDGKFLILDSYPQGNRMTASGYTWKSENEMQKNQKLRLRYFYYFTKQ